MAIRFNPLSGRLDLVNHTVKVIDVVDDDARFALTPAQVNVGDIVREVGAPAVEGEIIVADAGTEEADGTYGETSPANGKRTFSQNGANEYRFAFSGTRWELLLNADDSVVYYDQDDLDVDLPSDVVNWLADTGDTPVPSVTLGIAPVDAIAAGYNYIVVDTAQLANSNGWLGITQPAQLVGNAVISASTQPFNTGGWTEVIFDSVVAGFDANGRWTNTSGGPVSVWCDLAFKLWMGGVSGPTNIALQLRVNGVEDSTARTLWETVHSDTMNSGLAVSQSFILQPGDYLSLWIYPSENITGTVFWGNQNVFTVWK